MGAPSEHAPLPPSSAHMWVPCAGWRKLNDAVEPLPEDTTKAEEGVAAHWAVSEVLSGRQIDVGQIAPNGVVLDTEMCEGADLMDDTVGPERSSLFIEKRVDIGYVHPDNWGTPDAYRLFDNVLDVWDYKYGHRHVPAFENWQLLDYAVGIVTTLRLPPDSPVRVRLTIVQPRDYHPSGPVRTWELSLAELESYAVKLKLAAYRAFDRDPVCTVGDYCRDCKARHGCTALQTAALDQIDRAYEALPLVLSNGAVGRQVELLEQAVALMSARADGLKQQMMAAIRRGEQVLGYRVEAGKGRERWKIPVEEVMTLGAMMCVPVAKPTVITPKQAVKAGLPAELVAQYAETPVGELKLVRDDGSAAREAFGGAR